MKESFRIELPFGAVVKKNSRNIAYNKRTGRMFPMKSERLKEYEEKVRDALQRQLGLTARPLLAGKLKAFYTFYFRKKSRSDWDNLPAAIQDVSEAAGVFESDSQIKEAHVKIIEHAGEDKTEVVFEEVA